MENSLRAMFSRFLGKGKKNNHPLSSEAGIQALLEGMPREDLGFLVAIDGWLEAMPEFIAELGQGGCLSAVHRLDQASRSAVSKLLRDYLSSEDNRHLSLVIHNRLTRHVAIVCAAYNLAATFNADQEEEIASQDFLKAIGVGFFRIWGLGYRLARFRYLELGSDSWHHGHRMLSFLSKNGVLATNAGAFKLDSSGNPFREYLNVLYLVLAPASNLSPQQVEFVARLVDKAENLICLSAPDAHTTHLIDLSGDGGPVPYKPGSPAPDKASLRYLSTSTLQMDVQNILDAMEANKPVPKWFSDLLISHSQIAGALSAVVVHWSQEPPNRRSDRIVAFEAMRGTMGFGPALHLVEISEQARRDEPTRDVGADLLNRLWRLEEQVGRNRIEDWVQVDGSDDGLGVTIPTLLPRHVAGSLVALRYAEEPGWHLGLVRRIGDSMNGKPKLGLETFPGNPVSVEVFLADPPASSPEATEPMTNGFKAIAFDSNDHQLLIPTGTYAENLKLKFAFGTVSYQVRLTRLIESGPDYELVNYAIQ